MEHKAKIKEVFTSIQGEGPYIGIKQLFIRFCGCNLKCNYCDTVCEISAKEEEESLHEFTPEELLKHIKNYDLKTIHSISITGGEPLLWTDFLKDFLPRLDNKVYLETNATLSSPLKEIIDYVDYIAADIKLPSASGLANSFALHDEFFKVAVHYKKDLFAKIVFDADILDTEIENCAKLADKYNLALVLQPKMNANDLSMTKEKLFETMDKFLLVHPNTKLIPQVHKFLEIL